MPRSFSSDSCPSKMWMKRRMLEESQDSSTICTYCQLASREALQSRDLSDYWEEPSSFFMIAGDCPSCILWMPWHDFSTHAPNCKFWRHNLLLLMAFEHNWWIQSSAGKLKEYYICAGSLLKEAIEDLEWVAASGSVSLGIHRQPPSVTLSAFSAGSLQVKISV